jgi:hypothetical protein
MQQMFNKLRCGIERLALGSFNGSEQFFQGPQRAVVESYASSLEAIINSLFGGPDNEGQRNTLLEMLEKALQLEGRKKFEALLRIDSSITNLIPFDVLKARRWMFIDRFRRLAPQRAYLAYEGSLPAATDADRSKNNTDLRPDLVNINNYVQQTYILNIERERALSSIKWWLLTRGCGIGLMIAIVLFLAATPPVSWLSWMTTAPAAHALALVFLVGMVGAITSISRKFQEFARSNVLEGDPFNEIVALNAGRPSVAISIGSGGVFALVLYTAIAAGPLSDLDWGLGLFPSVRPHTERIYDCREPSGASTVPASGAGSVSASPSATPSGSTSEGCPAGMFPTLVISPIADSRLPPTAKKLSQEGLGFTAPADLLRMLLLAFIAGFAERLVPDTIDRLIKRERKVRGE